MESRECNCKYACKCNRRTTLCCATLRVVLCKNVKNAKMRKEKMKK